MPNISDWPNDAVVCSLSQVLVRGSIPPQYFLSSMACAGILRRSEARGKTLPEPLERALRAVANRDPDVRIKMLGFNQKGDPVVRIEAQDWTALLG